MEPAGLALGAIGLLGLFNLYQEAASVVHSVKNHSSETLRLFSRYNATKVLFERWGKQVGVADKDSFAQSVHPRLKDPATVNAVAGLLASISNVFTDVDPTVARYEQSSTSAAANPGRTKLRSRLKWALADSDKLKQNTEDFDDLVEKLYRLVPPEKLYPDEFQKLQASLIQSQRNQALHQVSHWLDATTTENTFDAYYSTRLDTTCNWIDTHPAYQGWLSGNADKMLHVLWMHGPGGFGKSVLCAYVVKSLQDSGTLPVYSFFCSGNSDAQRNPSAIPRSWVHQAVHQDDDILDLVLGYLNKCNNTKATHSDVLHLLRNIISHNPNLIFVVDGLDECPRTNTARTELHRNRCDILREIMNEGSGVGARLLVVSREEGDIKSQLRPHGPLLPGIKFDELAISKGNVSADVARFAEHVVTQKLAGNQHQLCQELSAQMAQKSDGMFLLIRLQSQNLRPRKGKNQLRRAVDEMPTDIVQVYKRHWDDIQRLPPSDKQRAEAILRWVLSEVVTFDDLPDEFDEEFVDDEILGLCGSFLELRAPTPDEEVGQKTVHLIHFSASEFLLGQHSGAPFAETMLQEYHLAQDCLRYLDCSGTWEPEPNENSGPVHDRPFSFYAIFHWFQHVSACAHSSYDVKSRLLPFFSPANPNWAEWRWRYEFRDFDDSEDEDSEGQEVSSPENDYSEEEHIRERVSEECDTEEEVSEEETEDGDSGCADSETSEIPDDVLEYLRKNDIFDKDESGGDYGNPLQAAAFRGQIGALKVLLDNGANPEAEGRFGSALHAAVAGNQEEAVAILVRHKVSLQAMGNYTITQQLLDNNSDVSVTDTDGLTPLMIASFYGRLEIVTLLGADQQTALHWAAFRSHVHIAGFLLDNGADLTLRDLEAGSPEVVKLLLDRGTPLISAVMYGHQEVLKLLLEYGADPESLLDSGADPYSQTTNGKSALSVAAASGQVNVVKALLDLGADTALSDSDGWTPLHMASSRGHVEIVEALLDSGANTEIGTLSGWTSLAVAAFYGHVKVITALQKAGANLDGAILSGLTPLVAAATRGNVEVVKVLLDLGANPDASDPNGRIPFDDSTFPTEDARQKRIRKTIDTLSGTPVPFENKDPILLDDLGRCLLRCRDLAAAAKVFGEALQLDGESGKVGHGDIICDECQDDIFGERWVCISCRFVNLCAPCMVKGPDDAERDFCIGHEYHCISTSGWDASLQTDVYTEEFVSWLKELRVQYGVAAL
ncbi:hypothetical protein BJY00DRAFT_324533 [Aspergillus carlsbadensis]|nr:hypothetical protein BJY00DRAFT_324533 [Aspergillus carlsbadensis]